VSGNGLAGHGGLVHRGRSGYFGRREVFGAIFRIFTPKN
jgi:hypothetical protein